MKIGDLWDLQNEVRYSSYSKKMINYNSRIMINYSTYHKISE